MPCIRVLRKAFTARISEKDVNSTQRLSFVVNAHLQKKRGVWRVNNVSEDHNHELTEGFAENRRLEDQEKNAVRAMARSGSSSSAILSFLRSEFGNNHTTRKVVQNEVAAARRAFLDGRTSVETVLQCLKDEHFVHAVKVSSNGSISGLLLFLSLIIPHSSNTCDARIEVGNATL